MQRVNVLHIIRPADGGMKNHLLDLIRYTNQDSYYVQVACPVNSSVQRELQDMQIPTLPIPLKGQISPRYDWETILLLIQYLRKHDITIVHAHGAKAALVGRIAAALCGIPVVIYTVHNSIYYENWSKTKKKLMALTERIFSYKTDSIITVSDALKREVMLMEQISKHKLITIYNGINLENNKPSCCGQQIRQSLNVPLDGKLVGVIARLAPQKGVTYFIKAADLLKDYNANFVIIGDGPLRQGLQAETSMLGLQNKIFFTGHRNDIAQILPTLDVLVIPSVTEGLSLVALEGMGAARAIVATKVGGLPEVITDQVNGILVEPKNPEQLAAAIAELITDTEKATILGEAGRRIVEQNFTIEQMTDKTMALYRALLTQKGYLPLIENQRQELANFGELKEN